MIAAQHVRKLALALPEAVEEPHFDRPSFRVRRRIFATLREDEQSAVLKLAREELDLLVASDPEVFAATPWAYQGWVRVALERVDPDLFAELLADAWRGVAPRRVVAAYDAGDRREESPTDT